MTGTSQTIIKIISMFNFGSNDDDPQDDQTTPFFTTNHFQVSSIFDDDHQNNSRSQFLDFFGNDNESSERSQKSYAQEKRQSRMQKLGIQKKGTNQIVSSSQEKLRQEMFQNDFDDDFYLNAVSSIVIPNSQQSGQQDDQQSFSIFRPLVRQNNGNYVNKNQLPVVPQQLEITFDQSRESRERKIKNERKAFESFNQTEEKPSKYPYSFLKKDLKSNQQASQQKIEIPQVARSGEHQSKKKQQQQRNSFMIIQKSIHKSRTKSKGKNAKQINLRKTILNSIPQRSSQNVSSNDLNKMETQSQIMGKTNSQKPQNCSKPQMNDQINKNPSFRQNGVSQVIKQSQNFKRKTEASNHQPILLSRIRKTFPVDKKNNDQAVKCDFPENRKNPKQSTISKPMEQEKKNRREVKIMKPMDQEKANTTEAKSEIQKPKTPIMNQSNQELSSMKIKMNNKREANKSIQKELKQQNTTKEQVESENLLKDTQNMELPKGIGKKYNLSSPWYKKHNITIQPVKIKPIAPPKIKRRTSDSKSSLLSNHQSEQNLQKTIKADIIQEAYSDLKPNQRPKQIKTECIQKKQQHQSNRKISLKTIQPSKRANLIKYQEAQDKVEQATTDFRKNNIVQRQNSLNRLLKGLQEINEMIYQGKTRVKILKEQTKQQTYKVQQLRRRSL